VLDCSENILTELNMATSNRLRLLNCSKNQLTSLNVSACERLETLNCAENQLPNLNVEKNTRLDELDCHGNKLKGLDVSQCRWREQVGENQFKQRGITDLNCSENQIFSMDISANVELEDFKCDLNPGNGTTLDVVVLQPKSIPAGFTKGSWTFDGKRIDVNYWNGKTQPNA
jgi:Leucine-rich repeat (LRR) protein